MPTPQAALSMDAPFTTEVLNVGRSISPLKSPTELLAHH